MKMLFHNISIFDLLRNQELDIKNKIQSLESNYVLNTSEEDLVKWLVSEFTFDFPTIEESGIHVDHQEKQINVTGDPNRRFFGDDGPAYVSGTQLTFIVPFTGSAYLFGVQPQNFSYSLSGSKASVGEHEIRFTYVGANLDGERTKRDFQNELQMIKQNLQNLKIAIDQQNKALDEMIRQELRKRKGKLLGDAQMVASLGFPIKKRDGVPVTYSIPISRHSAKIERPTASPQQGPSSQNQLSRWKSTKIFLELLEIWYGLWNKAQKRSRIWEKKTCEHIFLCS